LEAQFLSQPDLVRDFLQPYVETMRSCATPFERHVAAWCVGVGVPLSQFQPGEICVVAYEHLCTEPERVLTEVFAYLNRPFDPRIRRALMKPSSTTISRSELARTWNEGAHQITQAWKERASADQIQRGLDILNAFGMADLYDARPMPL